MNTEKIPPAHQQDRAVEPGKERTRPDVGSEAAQKGGKEPAKRQAERDWNNSSQESGE